ncbi:hypothetical protein [Hymenobacter rubripertinctus]|uniref:Uncharacterized protein n=1 Tax=Hymenobacter rubripertinctus TaxID=2029981 RepID=A0A418R540_9BACT|nr:hypothetical protein [Hymenobacter rubripertinctus]RIY12449.1 hypothetical protein D0T11_05440 [Hymenobacter rubripertinctus]
MKQLFFAAAVAIGLLSASQVQAQSSKKATVQPPTNTSVAPAARAAADDWGWSAGWGDARAERPVPTHPSTADSLAAVSADPMMQSLGAMLAPGMNTAPYRGASTDYHGRPVARGKSYRPRSVRVVQTDPMMQSSGAMLAPGMNTAPYRGASTDYHGRPLRQPTPEVALNLPATNPAVVAGW